MLRTIRGVALLEPGDQQHAEVEVRARDGDALGRARLGQRLTEQRLRLIEVQVVESVERVLVQLDDRVVVGGCTRHGRRDCRRTQPGRIFWQ